MSTPTTSSAMMPPLARDPRLLQPLEMDGYLTGLLVKPHVESSDWVIGIWHEPPAGDDTARMGQALLAVLAHRRKIEASFAKGCPGVMPGYCELGKSADHDVIGIWVRGFWSAMKLAPSYWSAIAEDQRTATCVALLAGFVDASKPFEERDDANEIRDQHAALLPRALVGMHKLALMREDRKTTLKAMETGKAGRNDLCPCGSGKKYKRCCATL